MAYILKTNGEEIPLKDLSLESLQKAVGGYIERLCTHDDRIMFVNEEGRLKRLPFNEIASSLWIYNKDQQRDIIVGDVVVGKEEEFRNDKVLSKE